MGTGDITLQSTTKANNKWYFAPGGSGGSLHIPLPLADSSWNPRTSQELWWAGKLRLISPVSNANGEFWVENQTPYCPGGPQVSNKIATNVQYAPPPLTISGPTPGPTKVCPNSANPDGIVKLTTDGVRPTRVRWYAREKFTGWTQDKNGAWVPIITPQNPPKLEWTGEKFDKAVAGTYYVTEDNPAGTCAVASPDYKVALDC